MGDSDPQRGDDSTTIVVRDVRVIGGMPPPGAPVGSGESRTGARGVLRKALALVVGLAVLALIIPLGLLAVACVAVIATVVAIVWATGRALAPRPGSAPGTPGGERVNVRVRAPDEA